MRIAYWICLLAVAAGCGREGAPTQPAVSSALGLDAAPLAASHSSLDALWPNEDGREWEYDYLAFSCTPGPPQMPIYTDPSQVPAAPLPQDVVRLLWGDRPGPSLPGTSGGCLGIPGTYFLKFNGEITTLSGVTAQKLEETLLPVSPQRKAMAASSPTQRLLQRVALARPDLRSRLGVSAAPEAGEKLPFLVHGGAWKKTAEHIGTYGDVDRSLAWKFLDADVKPGSSFDFQLIPSFADDVFLHAWVAKKNDALRLSGYAHEVEVVYVVDYGLLAVISGAADTIGYTRPVDYGSVVYVPGVGPVQALERIGAFADDPGAANGGTFISLKKVTPGSVAIGLR